MATLLETRGPGFFIAHEANGTISRETIIVKMGEVLAVGAILGKITASGKYVEQEDAAADGSQNAAGILYAAVDATDADVEAVAIVRHAEVNKAELVYPELSDEAGIDADLLALQIKALT